MLVNALYPGKSSCVVPALADDEPFPVVEPVVSEELPDEVFASTDPDKVDEPIVEFELPEVNEVDESDVELVVEFEDGVVVVEPDVEVEREPEADPVDDVVTGAEGAVAFEVVLLKSTAVC